MVSLIHVLRRSLIQPGNWLKLAVWTWTATRQRTVGQDQAQPRLRASAPVFDRLAPVRGYNQTPCKQNPRLPASSQTRLMRRALRSARTAFMDPSAAAALKSRDARGVCGRRRRGVAPACESREQASPQICKEGTARFATHGASLIREIKSRLRLRLHPRLRLARSLHVGPAESVRTGTRASRPGPTREEGDIFSDAEFFGASASGWGRSGVCQTGSRRVSSTNSTWV